MTELHDDSAVQAWLQGLATMWGQPLDDRAQRQHLAVLQRFVDAVGQSPSEMIEACTTVWPDGRSVVTVKGINTYWKLIEARRSDWGQDQTKFLLSFFIHNGVLMQSPI